MLEAIENLVDIRFRNDQRRQEPEYRAVAAAGFDDESVSQAVQLDGFCPFCMGRACLAMWAGYDDFNADHQAAAAYLAQTGEASGNRFEAGNQ